MAARYLVASGNWNSTSVWSATSGGAPGASVPIAGDTAELTYAAYTVTVTADTAVVDAINCSRSSIIVNSGVTLNTKSFNITEASGTVTVTNNGTIHTQIVSGSGAYFGIGSTVTVTNGTNSLYKISVNGQSPGYVIDTDLGFSTHTYKNVELLLGTGFNNATTINFDGSPTFNSLSVTTSNTTTHTVVFDNNATVSTTTFSATGYSTGARLVFQGNATSGSGTMLSIASGGSCSGQYLNMDGVRANTSSTTNMNIGSGSIQDSGMSWAIPSTKTKSLTYAVAEVETTSTITKDLTYTVLSTPSATTKSLTYFIKRDNLIQKNIAYTVTDTSLVQKTINYTVTTTASAIQKTLGYLVRLTPTATTKSLQYAVSSTVSAIQKGLTYGVDIIASPSNIFSPAVGGFMVGQFWTASTSSTLTEVITKTLEYAIGAGATISKSLAYVVAGSDTITKNVTYAVLSSALIQKSVAYTVQTFDSLTKSLAYAVLHPATITKSIAYAIIKTPTAITKLFTYSVVGESAIIQKTLSYRVVMADTIQKSINYAVQASQSITKNLTYYLTSTTYTITKVLEYRVKPVSTIAKALVYAVITTPSTLTKSISYQVVTNDTIQKGLTYIVEFTTAIEKNLEYRVITTPTTITKAMAYFIGRPISITKSLAYRIKNRYPKPPTMTVEAVQSRWLQVKNQKPPKTIVE